MKRLIVTAVICLSLVAVNVQAKWSEGYFADSFGDKIEGRTNIFTTLKGKFSNSATHNSDLFVRVTIEKGSNVVLFDLVEYSMDRSEVSFYDNLSIIEFKAKSLANPIKLINKMRTYEYGIGLKSNTLIDAIKENDNVKVFIYGNNASYNFIISGAGFTKAYNELNNIKTLTKRSMKKMNG